MLWSTSSSDKNQIYFTSSCGLQKTRAIIKVLWRGQMPSDEMSQSLECNFLDRTSRDLFCKAASQSPLQTPL